MKNNGKTKKIVYGVICGVVAVLGLLLAVALGFYIKSAGTAFARSEIFYVIAVMLIALFVLLVALFVTMLLKRKKGKPAEIKVTIDGQPDVQTSVQSAERVSEDGVRFDGLTKLDEIKHSFVRAQYDDKITLKGLCDAFRNYSASKLKLYYDEADIRRFISGMAVSHILILQGMSGTGKTSLAYAFGEFLGNTSTVIPVQPMWKERTDLIGYFNEFTKRFNETDLLKKMYEANYSRDIYVTVLDEMNIARVEYYFAEFLSLLELPDADKRQLSVVTDEWEKDPEQMKDGHIKLPENMWFIGTANNDDSTFAISDKVYDRAMIMDLDRKAEPFIAPKTKQVHISHERFEQLVKEAQEEYCLTERNKRRLEKLDKYLIEKFHITFGNRIMKQIISYVPVYVSCGGGELEALDDILARKVMRKLGAQNPVYIRNNAEKLISYMDELFGEGNMTLCKDLVKKLQHNA